ncbi:unnamed protein product [Colias eurytheme]|nr:unnamed protein product [Colias eurytheme]
MFYKIFIGEFNIGFSSPATDACNVCVLWKNKIKQEKDNEKKQLYMTELRVHKLRANAFYAHLKKNEPNSISACFDLQQVQSLPRTPIQDAFYARQLSLYNFCIVPLDSRNPIFYTWDESQSARGSTEVGSAVYNYLKGLTLDEEIHHLRLFCDGCGGQNKNSHIIHMLLFYLLNDSPPHLKDITLIFPVRGHSFLPADRVFGRLEKEIRKKPVITNKEEYYDVFKKYGQLKVLEDWILKDIKSLEEQYRKLDGIQSLKRIFFYKKRVRGSATVELKVYENYRFQTGAEKSMSLLKKGKRSPLSLHDLDVVQRPLKECKKKDISNLLKKQFGEEWYNLDELKWYKELIIDESNCSPEEEQNTEMESMCDCLTPDIGQIRI